MDAGDCDGCSDRVADAKHDQQRLIAILQVPSGYSSYMAQSVSWTQEPDDSHQCSLSGWGAGILELEEFVPGRRVFVWVVAQSRSRPVLDKIGFIW